MKKIIAGVLSACMTFSPLTMPVLAQNEGIMLVSEKESSEAENLEKVLRIVKSKVSVPEELTEFSYRLNNFSGTSQKSQWNFEWESKDNKKSMSITADELGNIKSYSKYDRDKSSSKPTYLKEELINIATEFIGKISPEIKGKIILIDTSFSGVYSGTYSYNFCRIENGIKMPDNNVSVSVDYENGEVKSFNSNWLFDITIPSSEVNIKIEEARKKIGEKVEMQLKYMNKTEKVDGKEVIKAYLVYTPDKSYMAVDAKTGEVYDTRDQFYDMGELNSYSSAEMKTAAEGAMAEDLSVEEMEKINEMANLLTKEDAILAITSRKNELLLDENAKAVDARLSQRYNYREKKNEGYIWQINFSDPRNVKDGDDTYRGYANATIDAETGKILSYYSSVRSYYDSKNKQWADVSVKYTSDECKKVFEKFVKGLEKDKFESTKLSNSDDSAYLLKYIDDKPVYGGYSYRYVRMNEGIEYSYNGINGKVDGVTGKIYSYNVNWTDNIEFESPKGSMSKEEAYDAYSKKDGFALVYEINNKHYIENNPKSDEYYDYSDLYELIKEVRLVYSTNINPQNISPFTGEQLDYSGKVYENVNEKEYTDIVGFWGERNIKLITDMGYNFEGNEFSPEKLITKEEWIKLLGTTGNYINEDEYKDIEKITKLNAIKMIIKSLNLEKVAKLSSIYKLPFNDVNGIPTEDVGYVALAKGLGIVNGDSNNNFTPNKELSRIEAVCIALNLASIR